MGVVSAQVAMAATSLKDQWLLASSFLGVNGGLCGKVSSCLVKMLLEVIHLKYLLLVSDYCKKCDLSLNLLGRKWPASRVPKGFWNEVVYLSLLPSVGVHLPHGYPSSVD